MDIRLRNICMLLAAAAITLNSCSKKEEKTPDPESGEIGEMQFTAVFSEALAESRATVENLQPVWQEGDKISLFGTEGVSRDLSLKSIDGKTAVFKGTAELTGPYFAVYPYDAEAAIQDGKKIAEIPTVQSVSEPGTAPGALLSVAYAEKTSSNGKCNLDFINACSFVSVFLEDHNITSIELIARDGTPIAGKVQVDPKTGATSVAEGEGSNHILLKPTGKAFPAGTYYIAVLPGSYEDLALVYSRDNEIRKGSWSPDGEIDLVRAKSTALGEVNQLDWGYYIANADDLKAWRNDAANWNPAGEIITFTGDVDLNKEAWEPLTDSYPGTIEGNGHRIYNFYIKDVKNPYAGFFGPKYAKSVSNLVFGSKDGKTYDGFSYINLCFDGSKDQWSYAGIFTYMNTAADIMGVESFVPVTATSANQRKSRVGGICAWVEGDGMNILNCINHGDVTVENHTSAKTYLVTAGILGGVNGAAAKIRNCTNYGTVTSKSIYVRGVGGIMGLCYSATKGLAIEDCVNEGDVKLLYSATHSDYFMIGGIAGRVICAADESPLPVRNCVNRGNVYCEAVHQNFVGGIVGQAGGVDVEGCVNEGSITIDHSNNATTRFQALGGIVGGAGFLAGYGRNIISNNENRGKVIMKVASSGHTATPSSSTIYYGADAAGILGLACEDVTTLTNNVNSGEISAENSFNATKAAYPCMVNAGGILGMDYGTIGDFSGNVSTGKVSAKTTASSVPSQAYAGGVAGRIVHSTMSDGTGKGEISATTEAGGSVYVGSIAGSNEGNIISCVYGGTVNGAAASPSNLVGTGNLPLQYSEGGGEGPQGGEFKVSTTSVSFPGTDYNSVSISISTGEEPVTVSTSGLDWLNITGVSSEIAAGKFIIATLTPKSGNVFDTRSGSITFREKTSGTEKTVTVNQSNLYSSVNGFPVKWDIKSDLTYATGSSANALGRKWVNEGIAPATMFESPASPSNGPGVGYISAVPAAGQTLKYSIDASSSTKTLCLGNVGEGDCIHFSVPVVSLPAGTDVDFMLTICTNNNATPKYWLFEYWDGSAWKADERYTATDGGNPKYSFYIQKFSSVNYRTYIQSFTLPSGVQNDFVKMRVRAVGTVNSGGSTLKRTASAYVYLSATTSPWQTCVIAAYPNAPAVKDVTKMMQLGNSMSFFYGSAFYLKQLCRAGGHQTIVRINLKGSQEYEHHLEQLVFSQEVTNEGGYAKAIIQDGSYFHAEYGAGTSSFMAGRTVKYQPDEILYWNKRMTAEILKHSPDCEIVLESLMSYSYKSHTSNTAGYWLGFGGYENFDRYNWIGGRKLCADDPNVTWLSPIGLAFARARNVYGYTATYNYLNWTDDYHPSRYGVYLKACVNYLTLFGDRFSDSDNNIHFDCDIPHDTAVQLRKVAEEIVFGPNDEVSYRQNYHQPIPLEFENANVGSYN